MNELAGVLSSILRSGPNGTSPIKFNLTNAINRVSNFQLFPILPVIKLPFTRAVGSNETETVSSLIKDVSHELESIEALANLQKLGKKRIIYRNPSKQSTTMVSEVRDPEDYSGENSDKRKTPAETLGSAAVGKPTNFPHFGESEVILSGASKPSGQLSESLDENGLTISTTEQPVTPYPAEIYTQKSAEIETSEIPLSLPDLDLMLFWLGAYFQPAASIVREATKNVIREPISFNVNVTNVIDGATDGLATAAKLIPNVAQAISGVVDYFSSDQNL